MTTSTQVTVPAAWITNGRTWFVLHDAQGRTALRLPVPAPTFTLMRSGLSMGIYSCTVEREGRSLHAGRLVIE